MSLYKALSNENPSAVQLFEQFRNGDRSSFAEIYSLHYQVIFMYVFKLTNNSDDAHDITIDAFAKLWHHRQKIAALCGIKPFLYAVAGNSAKDFLRRSKMMQFHHEQIVKENGSFIIESPDLLEQENAHALIYGEVMTGILEKLESLPPVRRSVFKMIFLDGKSTQEVAEALHISPQTVLNHKSQAVNEFRIWAKQQKGIAWLMVLEFMIRHHA